MVVVGALRLLAEILGGRASRLAWNLIKDSNAAKTIDNVNSVQRGHWESRLLLLTCIFQQYCYKFKHIFKFKFKFKYKYIIFLSACMGNITVWLAKHADCKIAVSFFPLIQVALIWRSNVANSNMCMI